MRRCQLRLCRCCLGIIFLLRRVQLRLSLLQCRSTCCNLRLGFLQLLRHGIIDFLMELQGRRIHRDAGCFCGIHLLLLLFQRITIGIYLLLQLSCLGLCCLQLLGLLLQLCFAVLQLLLCRAKLLLCRLTLGIQLRLCGIQLIFCIAELIPAVVQLRPGIG